MSKEEIASFIELDARKKLIESRAATMRAELRLMMETLRGINREQDAWLVSFASKYELLDEVDAMTFDVARGVAVVNNGSR
jgi:hypothetical protein